MGFQISLENYAKEVKKLHKILCCIAISGTGANLFFYTSVVPIGRYFFFAKLMLKNTLKKIILVVILEISQRLKYRFHETTVCSH